MLELKQIKQILECLYQLRFSQLETAHKLNVTRHQVRVYKKIYEDNDLSFPLPDDEILSKLFLKNHQSKLKPIHQISIDFTEIHHRMQTQKGATLTVLYDEWLAQRDKKAQIISYSQFAKRYRSYKKSLKISMRSEHKPAECVFVDYSGDKVPIINQETGEIRLAEIFVGVLGYSNYTYCEATFSQNQLDWNASHMRMFQFFNGVPQTVVPDNLKSAVIKSDKYAPTLNLAYQRLCDHYNIYPVPARAYKPKDKAKAEGGVLLVQRWILFRLKQQQFFSLEELNRAIRPLLEQLNNKKYQKSDESRRQRYLDNELPLLKPLPNQMYANEYWDTVRIPSDDYHAKIDGSFYSVPYTYRGKLLEYSKSSDTIKLYYQHELVAVHAKSHSKDKTITNKEHMPENHRALKQFTPEYILHWAQQYGEHTVLYFQEYLNKYSNSTARYRFVNHFKKLIQKYHLVETEVEHICQIALNRKTFILAELTSLCSGVQKVKIRKVSESHVNPVFNHHENLRGREHYSNQIAN